jgi:hypothetical protein
MKSKSPKIDSITKPTIFCYHGIEIFFLLMLF